jgi:hypothetical protein
LTCALAAAVLALACGDDDSPDGPAGAAGRAAGAGQGGGGGGSAAGRAGAGQSGAAGGGAAGGGAAGAGGASGAAGAGGAAGVGGSGGTSGAGGSGGAPAAGSGGASGSGGGGAVDCDALGGELKAWVAAHATCNESLPCRRLDLPANGPLCDAVAAPGGDGGALAALVDAWNAAGCDTGATCGFTPGEATCGPGGTCELVTDDACAQCPADLDPQCTVTGQNAINACYAEHCLEQPVAHAGFCADSAACVAAGGTCEETFFFDPPCPDGTRWNAADPSAECPGGNLRNTCCAPWAEPCSFVAGSMTLSLDPFTCAPPAGPGAPWTCLHATEQASCSLAATVGRPLEEPFDADVAVTAAFGNVVKVEGRHHVTGRTFACEGKVSYDPLRVETWACSACLGAQCDACDVDVTGLCNL